MIFAKTVLFLSKSAFLKLPNLIELEKYEVLFEVFDKEVFEIFEEGVKKFIFIEIE